MRQVQLRSGVRKSPVWTVAFEPPGMLETTDSSAVLVQDGLCRRIRQNSPGQAIGSAPPDREPNVLFGLFQTFGNHDMTLTRREFLIASAGLAAMPVLGPRAQAASLPRDADIVVIGAGAAGIAAARRIMAANRKVIVIEASGQAGGRRLTDLSLIHISEPT